MLYKVRKIEDNFVSLNLPTQNFSTSKYLAVGKNGWDEYKTLMKFDLTDIMILKDILKIELKLNINDVILSSNREVEIEIYNSSNRFDNNTLTWDNCPNVDSLLYTLSLNKNDKGKEFSIDITAIVFDWLYNGVPNNGLIFKEKSGLDLVIFESTNSCKEPYILVEYK